MADIRCIELQSQHTVDQGFELIQTVEHPDEVEAEDAFVLARHAEQIQLGAPQ
eukprot:CAMPEP_0198221304 /NCGR_PEP_ID=MMETSP1445-20131203/83092_1 /TAXON_ID=36898 /ORGANISM="Pyramimonas sp., Strain CCMP2087" /LENGTH=52 /DNA_ID=CAMNT_0043899401 /DNA_START=326 /DNA_END=481 /DNA_ORIENTATION=+